MNDILDFIGYGNFVLVLFILVLVHELGHYWVARLCGIKVEVFSIGFGREIFGWSDKTGTRWKLSLIPLGGYVKMKGEMVASGDNSDSDSDSDSFHCQPLLSRILVVAGGPFANYVYAVFLLAGLFIFTGQPQAGDYGVKGIGAIVANSVAEDIGLREGDIITHINERAVTDFQALASIVGELGDSSLDLRVLRGSDEFLLSGQPRRIESGGEVFYRLGIATPSPDYVKQDIGEALWSGVRYSYQFTGLIIESLGGIISGKTSTDDLGGPIRIAQISKDFGEGGWYALLYLTVILSINLGFLNLLPIPMLDGGHLLFYGLEALRGRAISARLQQSLMKIGLMILLFLIIWISFKDIMRIIF